MVKCNDCVYEKSLYPNGKRVAICTAPAGRYHKPATTKVNPNIERDCKLFNKNKMPESLR